MPRTSAGREKSTEMPLIARLMPDPQWRSPPAHCVAAASCVAFVPAPPPQPASRTTRSVAAARHRRALHVEAISRLGWKASSVRLEAGDGYDAAIRSRLGEGGPALCFLQAYGLSLTPPARGPNDERKATPRRSG